MDQELVRMVAGNGFSELLQRPLCGRMRGHVVMQNTTAPDLHHDENTEHPESGRDRNQEVTSGIGRTSFQDARPIQCSMQQIKTASATVVVASVPSSAVRPWLSQPAASVHSIAPPVAPSVVAKVEASADGQAAARERREDAEERRRSG